MRGIYFEYKGRRLTFSGDQGIISLRIHLRRKVLIPTFALERAQELLYIFKKWEDEGIWPSEWKVVKVYTINGFSSHAGRDGLIECDKREKLKSAFPNKTVILPNLYDEFKIPA